MKTENMICIVFFILLVTGCQNDESVVASFSVSPSSITSGETVSFRNESVNANYFQWNFGDGSLSFDKNPTHIFSYGGNFDVKLVAIGNGGADSITTTISVTPSYNVTIYPGKGINGVNLYDTWSSIRSSYNNSTDTVLYVDYISSYAMYIQQVYYYDEGVVFTFFTESATLKSSDQVYLIYLVYPYEGYTSKGITVGSSLANVKSLYGEPETSYNGDGYTGYWYDSDGIDFYSYDSGYVDEIDIYEPNTFTSSVFSTPQAAIAQSIAKNMRARLSKEGLLKNQKIHPKTMN
jgi:PKD repeat protein